MQEVMEIWMLVTLEKDSQRQEMFSSTGWPGRFRKAFTFISQLYDCHGSCTGT